VAQHGLGQYEEEQFRRFNECWQELGLPPMKTFCYSGHQRTEATDAVVRRYFLNFRDKFDENAVYRCDNSLCLS
jgi:hypothetical protein